MEDFLVVGIGASAGGIQAIKQFFERVPANSGIAYVVILHLSPEHESHLAEVLQVSAAIPVTQVQGRVRVEPNHVYVVPPHQSLAILDGYLAVSDMTRFEERRAPVDIFFRTLADSHRSRAVCVVLSGTGANGSMGLKRVKEQGGVCLVQDPDEAEYGDMPRNSIATSLVDYVLPVADIPAKIIAYRDTLNAVHVPEEPATPPVSDEEALHDIFLQLRSRTGHDFTNYKRATVLRRIARRMGLFQIESLTSYGSFLREHADEPQALLKDLLISVTNFFRDREAFEILERRIIPRLFEHKDEQGQVRIWIAGCATGEEAYSIAMLAAERASMTPMTPAVQVFATDIDEAAIAIARDGVYTLNDAADVSPERLRRFFTRQGDTYRVRKELREMILFAHHNIIKDPPFSHLDLVSCRNLLIYLNRTAQQRVMQVIHFALNPGGYMFLGSSESVDGGGDLFAVVDKDAYLYQSRVLESRPIVPTPDFSAPALRSEPAPDEAATSARARLTAADLHQRLLEQYAAPSIVVDEQHDILHLSEHAGRFLHHQGGDPSHNLLSAIRPELRLELRTALYQAAQQRTSVEASGLVLSIDGRMVRMKLTVRPVLRQDDSARGFFLVLFEETPDGVPPPAKPAAPLAAEGAIPQLEDEVRRLKSQLRTTVEQHETQAEELKASNEELQAMNEELRSSAEELETSKEELQSLNEELRTVNQELKIKVEEQAQANDDIRNLINSTEIGTIFLDRSSRIKLFTPQARDIFTLIPGDRGRPLSDINSALLDTDLQADIDHVLERLVRIEREVKTRDGRWHLMRVLPYRTSDDRIDGVVLTFVDISERKRAEGAVRSSEERLRLMVESVTDYALFTSDAAGRIATWNPGAARMFGYPESEAIGQSMAMLFTPEDRQHDTPAAVLQRAAQDGHASDERWHVRKDGSRFFASGAVTPLRDQDGGLTGFVKIARDLTERKHWEDALQRAHADLEVRVLQRTQELAAANQALDAELRERREKEAQIRGLMHRLLTVQEDERRRIALDLHDHVGQQIAALGLKIGALTDVPRTSQPLRTAIEDVRQMLTRLDRDLDFFTSELRPASLDDLGLQSALRNYVADWSREFGIRAEFHGSLENVRLGPDVETNLYRIAQEALNNIYKHARARHVGVILERRGREVVLLIEDNGVGFNRAEPSLAETTNHLGLLGMQERAHFVGGTLEIESEVNKGTTVFVRVALPDNAPDASAGHAK